MANKICDADLRGFKASFIVCCNLMSHILANFCVLIVLTQVFHQNSGAKVKPVPCLFHTMSSMSALLIPLYELQFFEMAVKRIAIIGNWLLSLYNLNDIMSLWLSDQPSKVRTMHATLIHNAQEPSSTLFAMYGIINHYGVSLNRIWSWLPTSDTRMWCNQFHKSQYPSSRSISQFPAHLSGFMICQFFSLLFKFYQNAENNWWNSWM